LNNCEIISLPITTSTYDLPIRYNTSCSHPAQSKTQAFLILSTPTTPFPPEASA